MPIITDDDHAVALARLDALMAINHEPGTDDAEELDRLADEIKAYEERRWPI